LFLCFNGCNYSSTKKNVLLPKAAELLPPEKTANIFPRGTYLQQPPAKPAGFFDRL
jgi:hypothetical protein